MKFLSVHRYQQPQIFDLMQYFKHQWLLETVYWCGPVYIYQRTTKKGLKH